MQSTLPVHTRRPSDDVQIYAELLSHVKKIALHIQLPGPYTGVAEIRGLSSGLEVEVTIGSRICKATLPAAVNVEGGHIRRTLNNVDELSLRLEARRTEYTTLPVVLPWTATSLTTSTEICCAKCNGILLERGHIKQWKDLPSEGWAEMMEFWHCHKPDEPAHASHQTSSKGYSAAGRLQIMSGTGLVDTATILISAHDGTAHIQGVSESGELYCRSCSTPLGYTAEEGKAHRLAKYRLAISTAPSKSHETTTPPYWLACRLLQAVEDYGMRRFVMVCDKMAKRAVSVWVFAPDLLVSHSKSGVRHVVKVMWKSITVQEIDDLDTNLNAHGATAEILSVTRQDLDVIWDCLSSSQEMLPDSLRTFQEWSVGLLLRSAKTAL